MQDIVLTGIGVACPIGIGREAVWSAIENRQSGVRHLPWLAEADFPSPIGGELPDFQPKQYVKPRKSLKVMCRETQIGFTAAELAWADAGLPDATLDPERLGVVLGTNIYRSQLDDLVELYQAASDDGKFSFENWGTAMREMYPLWMLKYLPNMAACHIGISHDARGPINSIVQGSVSGLTAIVEAADAIARGHADIMLAGGTSSTLAMVDIAWHGGAELSRNIADPAAACRPFEAARDGTALSEGAAIYVLESRAHAEQRGANIQGQLLGYGRRSEPCADDKKPTGQAIRQAIEASLQSSGLQPTDIGHVNAHGMATLDDDRAEAKAIAETLSDVPVTAPKSYLGNIGAAGGAVELAVSLLGLQNGVVPPTLNYDHPDPQCPANVVGTAQPARTSNVLALSHKLTGQAVSLVVSIE